MNLRIKGFLLGSTILLMSHFLVAQGEANIWYFGENGGLDFSTTPATVIAGKTGVDGNTDIMESSSAMSDENGNLLFSVVGKNIYSADGVIRGTLPNGSNWNVSQGSMIVKKPGSTNQYYITVVPAGTSPCSSAPPAYIPITVNGTTGNNITVGASVNLSQNNVSQGQMILPITDPVTNAPTGDYWLIYKGLGNNELDVYKITSAGITFSHTATQGPAMNSGCAGNSGDVTAYFKSNGCYTQFSYSYGSSVYLFDFDTKTGQPTYKNSAGPINEAYGMEFSSNGKYVYVSTGTWMGTPQIYQIPVSPGGTGSTLGTPVLMGSLNGTIRGGALQMGPDGNIYAASFSSWSGNTRTDYLGMISNPNGPATWNPKAIAIPNSIVGMGLPSFMTSLIAPQPKLLANGIELSQTSVCVGDNVTFEIEVNGTKTNGVTWKATGSNTKTQNGGTTFSMTMTNQGTTNVEVVITDECGRQRTIDFDVEIEPYQNANGTLAACPSRVVTGTGSTSGQYAWYTADPKSGGTFLGYGATYDASALTSIWVQPTSNVTQTNINDTRTAENWGSASGGTSVAISTGSGKITSFDINTYTWGSYSGNLTVELRDKNNVVVGTPVTKAMSGSGQQANIFSPTDWNISAANGPYSINVTSTGGASFGQLSTNNFSSGAITLTGGRASKVKITTFKEDAVLKCFTGKLVSIPNCCTQLAPTAAITTGTATVCEGKQIILTATKNAATTGTVTYQWYNDDGAISGATSATYTVPTGTAAAAKDYWVTVTSSGSCSGESPASNKIKLTINGQPTKPTITVAPNKASFCKGEAYTLTANSTVNGGGSITYAWSIDGTGSAAATNGKTAVGNYTYLVTVSSNGCSDTTSKKVNVIALPDSSITSVGPFCGDASTAVNLVGATAGGSWKIDNVALVGSSFVPKNYTTGMHVVEYDVTVNGCSSDDTMQFHIIKRDTADITPVGPYCKNAAAVTLKGKNSGGVWSGAGITDANAGTFNPKNASVGPNTITYTIAGTCGDTKTTSITINAIDSAEVMPAGPFCSSSSATTIQLQTGSTTGGVWSGTNINATTGLFDPSGLSQGTYKLKYTSPGACKVSDSIDVLITNSVNFNFVNPKTSYCNNASLDTVEVDFLGGTFRTFSGLGITNASQGYLNPALMTPGVDTVYYEKSGMCGDTIKLAITINAVDVATLSAFGPFCESDVPQQLQAGVGSAAGTWSAGCGACITGTGMFNPTTATAGKHAITYTTSGACPVTVVDTATVTTQMKANIINADTTLCGNATAKQLSLHSTTTAGGLWFSLPAGRVSGTGLFDPNVAGAGITKVYYGVTGASLMCSAVDSVTITVAQVDTASLSAFGPFCESDAPQQFQTNPGSSAGTWSASCGACISGSGMFDPSTATAGKHVITYTTSGACPVTEVDTATVTDQMVADITTPATTKCKNASSFQIALSNTSTTGGTWLSVPAGKVSGSGMVDPSAAGVGMFRVYYGVAGASLTCSAVDSVDITITPIDTAKITLGQGPFCVSDPVQTLQKEAASSAGVWSGTGIVSGNLGTFNPATAGVGGKLITYTTSGACPVTDTMTIYVVNQMVADITTANNTNICVDNGLYQINKSAGSTAGGTWSSIPTGLVDNQGRFNPQTAGVSNGIWIYYSVSGATATCSAKDSIQVNVLPREEAQITDGATKTFCTYDAPFQLTPLNAGGTWSGTGVTAGGLFSPSTAGAGGPYAIRYKLNGATSLCPDEDTILITVVAPLNASINPAGPFCENLGTQQLTPVLAGGTFSGTGVSASGVFNPQVAGPGSHWIKYTQGGQCPNVDSVQITVEALPQVIISPDVVGGCAPLLVSFGDSSTSASQVATWSFGDGGGKTMLSANGSTTHTYSKIGTFDVWLKMQFQNGCKDSAQTKITVTEVPVADFTFGPNPASTMDPTISFTNQTTGATNYKWNFGSTGTVGTPSSSTNTNETVWFDPSVAEAKAKVNKGMDSVPVTLKASNAVCSDSITKMVFIKDVFTLYVPNAFSPNGDGVNEEFYPGGLNHVCDVCTNYEFMVFNRWGEMIFRTTDPNVKWNGKRDNNLNNVQIDVYVWKVVYTDSFTGKEGKQMGTVTLMR